MKQKNVRLSYLISLAISIVLAFSVGAVILALTGHEPLSAYRAMFDGAFSAPRHIGDVMEYFMVLALCGLACDLGSRVGIFNVGGEGQLLLGAIAAAQVGVWLNGSSPWLVLPLAALAAIVVGGLYALIPGVLKVKVKVNEVITTIMLNTVAALLCQYLSKGPWKSASKRIVAGTEKLGVQYWFHSLIPGSNFTTAIFAAALIALVLWFVMQRTSKGFEMKLTGQNPRFARYAGLKTDRIVLVCMVLSGALCGLVGMFRVFGAEHMYRDSISNDYYFEGLMVAMIAQYQPVATILLSLFFAVLKIGAQGMAAQGISNYIYLIIQTIIIFAMAAERGVFRAWTQRRERRKAEREAKSRLEGGVVHG